jgi:hypothetical protein
MNAQERNYEKIKAHKTAYITEKVNLTSAQAEKFWPIYNQFEAEVMILRKAEREEFEGNKKKNIDGLSDAEANAMLLKHNQRRGELTEKLQILIGSLKGVISPQQTLKLLRAEEDFKRRLLRRYGERERPGKDRNKRK